MPSLADVRKQYPGYEDLPDRDFLRGVHGAHYSDVSYQDFLKAIDFNERVDPTEGMNFGQKFSAGFGKALTDIGQGASQLVGMGPSSEEVQDRRQLDAPLMNTGAGIAGNVAGNITAMAPLALVPGANTVAGAGALGMTAAALQPTEGVEERAKNMAVGGALGAGTQAIAGPGARALGEWGAKKKAEALAAQSRNAVRDATIREGQQAGYVVPPSAVNEPSFIGGRLESLAGKAALGQESSIRNQKVTDQLARRAAGLMDDEPISTTTLKAARQRMSAPYREVAALDQRAAMELENVKAAKLESKLQWAHYNRSGDPAAFKAATQADQVAELALNNIERSAQAAGKPELVNALKKARVDIARNHEVRNALNSGTGSIDASVIGRAFDRNPDRFSGDLRTIASYQQAFPHFMREASGVPTPQVGKTELLASALLAGGGGMAAGPMGMAAGLAPFASGPTRAALLSKPVQQALATPSYKAGAVPNAAAALNDPETQRRVAALVRALSLPAVPQAVNE